MSRPDARLGRLTWNTFTTSKGGTGAAKESLKWLAMPSSGAFVLATVAVLVVLITAIVSERRPGTVKDLKSN